MASLAVASVATYVVLQGVARMEAFERAGLERTLGILADAALEHSDHWFRDLEAAAASAAATADAVTGWPASRTLSARTLTALGVVDHLLVDTEGRVLDGPPGLPGKLLPGWSQSPLQDLLRPDGGRAWVGLPERLDWPRAAAPLVPLVMAGAPVGEPGRRRGLLVLLVDPAGRWSEVMRRYRFGDTGEAYAYDRTGRLLTMSRFEPLLKQRGLLGPGESAILNQRIRPGIQGGARDADEATAALLTGRAGMDLQGYIDYRGERVLGAWRWNSARGYAVAVELDAAEAYSGTAALGREAWVVVVASWGLVALVATLALWSRARGLRSKARLAAERDRYLLQVDQQAALLDALPNPVFVKGPDGRYIAFNRAYENAFRIRREDLVGRTVADLDFLGPADRRRVQDQDERLLKARGDETQEVQEAVCEIALPDGTRRTVLNQRRPFLRPDGSPGGSSASWWT